MAYWESIGRVIAYLYNSLHGFVQCNVQPTRHSLVEPNVGLLHLERNSFHMNVLLNQIWWATKPMVSSGQMHYE